ncbi:MAG: carbohydrate porin [Opitutaceae bacterium]
MKLVHSSLRAVIVLGSGISCLLGAQARAADGPQAAGPTDAAVAARAAIQPSNGSPPDPGGLFDASQWSVHAQATVIEQWHYGFPAEYSGRNSLESSTTEDKHTVTATLFIGRRLWTGAEIYFDPEVPEGEGLSSTVGMAGFPNGEGTRAAGDSPHYNTSRLFLQQTFEFGGGKEKIDDDENQLAGEKDVDRLTLTAGKFAAVDYFDDNAYSHDPRTQFLNWSLMDSGAWDYPADTRGYTAGFVAELKQKDRAIRYGIMMEPQEANQLVLDKHVTRAFAQVLEFDQSYSLDGHPATVRPFVFFNRADMGSYSEAIENPAADLDVTRTRAYRSKVGAGLSWDQELTADAGTFLRLSWNDGKTESWAFTEIDRSVATGISMKGTAWGRADDVAGLAGVVNGLSPDHRRYLAAGGYGFIVGDGRLNYGPEEILEAYYDVKIVKGVWLTPDFQYAEHPGYNRDRGGLPIFAIRAHFEY